ncbi:MAG: response regulator [Syntrophobacteraceae bacterium]|nr:response regulator [Desulfobacteraceae bacterium]
MSGEQSLDVSGKVGLRGKLFAIHAVIVLAVVSVLTAWFIGMQQRQVRAEMLGRAAALAKNFARSHACALLSVDLPAIGQAASGMMTEEGVAFVRIRGPQGEWVFTLERSAASRLSEPAIEALMPAAGRTKPRTADNGELLLAGVPVNVRDCAIAGVGDSGVPRGAGEVVVGYAPERNAPMGVSVVKSILAVAGAVAAVALLIAFAAIGFMTRPLKPLVFGAKAVALGNFAFRAPVSGRDELGSLAASFNEMARKLEDNRKLLEEYGRDLERKVAERTGELARREEEVTWILENLPAGILLVSAVAGEVAYANSHALRILGGNLEAAGRRLARNDGPWGQERPEDVSNVRISECRLPVSSGMDAPVLTGCSRILHNGAEHYLLVFIQMSEYKRLEARFRQDEKMCAVGTLAGGVAHDFNNLLQAILGSAQLFQLRGGVSEKGRKLLDQVEKAVQRGSDLIHQLLTFSRRVESRLRPLDLNQELRRISVQMEKTIPKQISIELDLGEDVGKIEADPLHLEQAVVNLAANARDAMPEGGCLTLKTRRVCLSGADCRELAGLEPGEHAVLSVTDTGTGMDCKILEHIFEPFFTTKEVGKGTGLGLATVYGIVRGHGGHISCTSKQGCGTSFDIYFRLAADDAACEDRDRDQTVVERSETGNILVVDDEEPVLQLGVEVLEGCGYRVHPAENGERALEIFEKEMGKIDLVILDLGMPGIGGLACFHRLRDMDRDLKIVIASGYTDIQKRKEMMDAGASAFVGKPYRFGELISIVRRLLPGKQFNDFMG